MDGIMVEKSQPLRRLPGLFRRWDFAEVIETGKDYHVEEAGFACDGTALFAIYVGAARATSTISSNVASWRGVP